ncbi:MAG: cobalamin biosynthesis protein CbiM [Chitinivibrionales bacterium]|nr:cobalamin biosynthesis protein CbiM [Chitinivibrionales bacterium]MBD3356367.1 cobalamin biosynthesis protein CbiM [Chitinivibrionales bacterium]
MHISDGILSPELAGAGYVLGAGLTLWSLRSMNTEEIPRVSVVTAGFFAASLLHLKLGPVSVHPVLNGLVGMVLGTASIPAIAVGLLFQAVLFGHGGLTSLGANLVCIGGPALIAGLVFRGARAVGTGRTLLLPRAFLAGVIGVAGGIILVGSLVALTEKSFVPLVRIAVGAHIALAGIEGVLCVMVAEFLSRVKPSLLGLVRIPRSGDTEARTCGDGA